MLFQVLKISLIGHRKRILASLGDRLHDDPPQKPPRSITLRVSATAVSRSALILKNMLCNKMIEATDQEIQAVFLPSLTYLDKKNNFPLNKDLPL